ATLLAFDPGQWPRLLRCGTVPISATLPRRQGAIARIVAGAAAIGADPTLLSRARTTSVVALDGRLAMTLLAFIVVVDERTLGAGDLRAMVAIGLEAMLTDQGTDARGLLLDRIERIGVHRLGVEPGASAAVELRQRVLGGRIPIAIGIAAVAADATQLGLDRLDDLGLRRRWIK